MSKEGKEQENQNVGWLKHEVEDAECKFKDRGAMELKENRGRIGKVLQKDTVTKGEEKNEDLVPGMMRRCIWLRDGEVPKRKLNITY